MAMAEAAWRQQDWAWDPIAMTAKPAESKAKRNAGRQSHSSASEGEDRSRSTAKLTGTGCQVDGCTADLATMRDYHQRYKICEFHLKTPCVVREGMRQRFCQQCGKFQALEEFDGEKRSCRARLERHNARRRRQREVAHLLKKGIKLDPQAVMEQYQLGEEELASKVSKLQEQGYPLEITPSPQPMQAQQPAPDAGLAGFAPGVAGIDFLPADLNLLDEEFLDAVLVPGLMPAAAGAPGAGGMASDLMLEMDPSQIMDLDDMAILEEITQEFGLSAMRPPVGLPQAPAVSPFQQAAASGVPPYKAAPPAMASLPSQTGMGVGFSFPPTSPAMADQPARPPSFSFDSLQGSLGSSASPLPPFLADQGSGSLLDPPASVQSSGASSIGAQQSAIDSSMSVIDEALNLLAYDATQVTYIPEDRLFRFSAKLFNCTPDQLPTDLKASLINMLTCNSLEGYIRPGCVHVTVDALVGPEEREAMASQGVRGVVERLVAQQPEAFWAQHTMLVQLGDKMALVREGQVVHVLATAGSTQVFPKIAAVRPLVAAPAADGSAMVTVWGYNLAGGEADDVVLARSQGKYVNVERVGEVASDPSWGEGLQRMELRVSGVELGALQVEIMRGGFISSSKTLLVHVDPQLTGELRQLESDQTGMDIDTTLFELGRVVEFGAGGRSVAGWGAEERQKAGKAARRMLAFAIQRKWVGVTRALLAALAADLRPVEAVAAADVMAAGTTGMPLLQLAVRTQSRELVAALLAWGRAKGYSFKSSTPGRRGLTALHLAALIRDQGVIAGMITEMCDDAVSSWETATAEDGTTPMAFAQAHGNAEIIRHLIAAKHLKKAMAAGLLTSSGALTPAVQTEQQAAAAAAHPLETARSSASSMDYSASPSAKAVHDSTISVASFPTAAAAPAAPAVATKPAPAPISTAPAAPASPVKKKQASVPLDHMASAALPDTPSASKAAAKARALERAGSSKHHHDIVPADMNMDALCAAGGKGGFPAAGVEEFDEIAQQKAEGRRRRREMQAATAALSFRDPALEAKYAAWYHSGQVPVDVAFIVIAVLSQGAWVFRWSLERSALGLGMVALMALNAALIQMACLFPATYRQYREALCILSHMLHKVVQLLVTVSPAVGTIYSPTYNATVAVLESSSFAQVMMLSFGVKMRFAYHVLVNLFHLAVSALVNDQICSAAWPRVPGALCHVGLLAFQVGACFLLPSALVYLTERRSRRIFLETVVD